MARISIVVPIFNEAENIGPMSGKLLQVIGTYDLEILFVDDGSTDESLAILKNLNDKDKRVKFISLSRNFGQQYALKAGLDHASGDAVITMDGDFQHPPSLLPEMIGEWKSGRYDMVLTKRKSGNETPFLKQITSSLLYRIMNFLSEVPMEADTPDFRLMDRKVVEVLKGNNEPFLFLRGSIAWMGFRKKMIEFEASPRLSGTSKYSLGKMMGFALDGITSFSIKPLRLATLTGLVISFFAFLYALVAVSLYFFSDRLISGWASILVSILFMGGIQLIMIGILGEYIGKIFITLMNRPNYLIREKKVDDE